MIEPMVVTFEDAARGSGEAPPFKPFGPRVLLKAIRPESNVLLPDGVDHPLGNWARVVAVGTGYDTPDGGLRPCRVQVGAKVLLPPHPVVGVTIAGEQWIVCHETELLGELE